MADPMNPKVSVIVPAYNERRYMTQCIQALLVQTDRPLEIVVVDDGSRDGTTRAVARFPDVRLVRQPHLGAAAARNLGVSRSTGDILVFVDADMACSQAFVEHLVAPMIERGAVGTFTKEIRPGNGHRWWARAHQIGRGFPVESHFPPDFPDRWVNFRAAWRADFLRVGGFDQIGYGEDVTLGKKLGTLAEAAPGAAVEHFEPDTFTEVLSTARWYGRGERIKEYPRWTKKRPAWRQAALPFLSAAAVAKRNRMPPLFIYRIVWELGVTYGWLTRGRGSAK